MAAVASATMSMWPASAAEQPPAAPQNSELQQAAGPAAPTGLTATGAVTAADMAGVAGTGHRAARQASRQAAAAEQIGGQALVFKPGFVAGQDKRLAVQARRAAAATAEPACSPQQIATSMLGSYGWSSSEFGCLNDLWSRESG